MGVLLRGAYGITMPSQIVGLPGWADSDLYDIEAKADTATVEAWKSMSPQDRRAQTRLMEQALLADRCQLKVHYETREMAVYELVAAKGGVKLKEVSPDEHGMAKFSSGKIEAQPATLPNLTSNLSLNVGRLIIDKTGLTGKYDFTLTWAPDNHAAPSDSASDSGPDIFTALKEQLGLELVPAKAPVDVLIVDHIERPSPN
jgi:uncharacterized protein (TIGR03435 family)